MSTESPNTTELPQNLTAQRGALRAFHNRRAHKRADTHHYRGIKLRREPGSESQTYEVVDGDTVLGSIELDTFHNADDLVRFCDAVVNHGFEAGLQWVREDLNWGWDA